MDQMTDARGARSGAALSVALLSAAALAELGGARAVAELLTLAVGTALFVSAATALRVSLLAVPFRALRAWGIVAPPRPHELEPVIGLRLAQWMGGGMLLAGSLAGLLGLPTIAVALVAVVAALQSFLAITGICIACRFYGIYARFARR